MTARPIIFGAPMIRAILAGEKTQTRRIVRFHPSSGYIVERGGKRRWHRDDPAAVAACPYGQPGDTLWVRENYQYAGWTDDGYPLIRYQADGAEEWRNPPEECIESVMDIWAELSKEKNYNIDQKAADRRWRPSIHMPRWASRITLEIASVRVERLQDISEDDCCAEGCGFLLPEYEYWDGDPDLYRKLYRALWESIYGPDSWAANPWVWAIEFRRAEK